jgi:hypothetical protein
MINSLNIRSDSFEMVSDEYDSDSKENERVSLYQWFLKNFSSSGFLFR